MKKITSVILVILVAFLLSACGKSQSVKAVEEMIDSLGSITADSQGAINEAMDAYNLLSEKDAEKVENADILFTAVNTCAEMQLFGDWSYEPTYFYDVLEMFDKVDLSLKKDMTFSSTDFGSGTWYVEAGQLVLECDDSEYPISLAIKDESIEVYVGGYLIRTEKYNEILNDMFNIVELTPENVEDYCKVAIITEDEIDAFGQATGNSYSQVTLTSNALDDGWMYLASSDLAVELIIPEHSYQWKSGGYKGNDTAKEESNIISYNLYGTYGGSAGDKWDDYETVHDINAEDILFGRVKGTVVFVNSAYVDSVKEDNGSRMLCIGDGEYYTGPWMEGLDY